MSKVKLTYTEPSDPKAKRILMSLVEYATGRRKIEKMYNHLQNNTSSTIELWDAVLEALQIHLDIDYSPLKQLQKERPVLFIANHPFGIVDGLILGKIIAKVKQEFKILVHGALTNDEALSDFLLPVVFKENKAAVQTNLATRHEVIRQLTIGNAIGIFPAGGVATAKKIWGKAEDLEWKRFIAKAIHDTKADVVPIYFHGQNSPLFQFASKIHPDFRLSLLINEIRNKRRKTLKVEIGDPVFYSEMAGIKNRQALVEHLKEKVWSAAKAI